MTAVATVPAPTLDRPATRADLDLLPRNIKGEIIDGVLYTQPRPRPRHSHVAFSIGGKLYEPYSLGKGGPGGWWILGEPGIELPSAPEVAPDVAGWRRERMPELAPDDPIRLAPDWACEVLSPSNQSYDRTVKLPFYARVGVAWLWLVEPRQRTVEVKRLRHAEWVDVATVADDGVLSAEPFPELSIPLSELWLPDHR